MAETASIAWSVAMTMENHTKRNSFVTATVQSEEGSVTLRHFPENDNFTVTTTLQHADGGTPLISDEAIYHINIYVNIVLRGSIAVFGVINNIINMIIFYRLGLKDSMSVGLMALSFTDFIVTLLHTAGTMCAIWEAVWPDTAIKPGSFEYVAFGWLVDFVYLISGWITSVLSVERCVCVVFPFKVKQIFTRVRCLVIIVVIYIVHIAVHMPVFLSQWLDWKKVKVTRGNETVHVNRMVVFYSDNRAAIKTYIDVANGAVLPFPAQILVVISVVWMIVGLKVSSRIRTSAVLSDTEGDDIKKSNLSQKETRLVKVVLFLAIILTVCNVPRFLAVYAKQIFPEVNFGSRYGNLYSLLWNMSSLTSTINSSVNIFVYLIINTNYQIMFKALLKRK